LWGGIALRVRNLRNGVGGSRLCARAGADWPPGGAAVLCHVWRGISMGAQAAAEVVASVSCIGIALAPPAARGPATAHPSRGAAAFPRRRGAGPRRPLASAVAVAMRRHPPGEPHAELFAGYAHGLSARLRRLRANGEADRAGRLRTGPRHAT